MREPPRHARTSTLPIMSVLLGDILEGIPVPGAGTSAFRAGRYP